MYPIQPLAAMCIFVLKTLKSKSLGSFSLVSQGYFRKTMGVYIISPTLTPALTFRSQNKSWEYLYEDNDRRLLVNYWRPEPCDSLVSGQWTLSWTNSSS